MFSKLVISAIVFLTFASVALCALQQYRVEGRLMYRAPDGSVLPAAHVTAQIYDRDIPPDRDDLLAVALTDGEGMISAEFAAQPHQDIYVRFVPANSSWKVTDSGGSMYQWHTLVFWDSVEEGKTCTVTLGTFVVGRPESDTADTPPEETYESVGALWIFEAVRKANDFCTRHGIALSRGDKQIRLIWPSEKGETCSVGVDIHVAPHRAGHRDIIIHEIGHILMSTYSRIPRGAGGRHRIDKSYNEQLAWSEGWATFFAACVLYEDGEAEPMLHNFGGGISIEDIPESIPTGDRNEMRVAAALWDLYDVVQDGSDNIGIHFADIWEVLAESRGRPVSGFRQFALLLVRHSFTDERIIRGIQKTLAHNSIHYELEELLRARRQ